MSSLQSGPKTAQENPKTAQTSPKTAPKPVQPGPQDNPLLAERQNSWHDADLFPKSTTPTGNLQNRPETGSETTCDELCVPEPPEVLSGASEDGVGTFSAPGERRLRGGRIDRERNGSGLKQGRMDIKRKEARAHGTGYANLISV